MELIPESAKKSIFSAKDCTLFIAPLVIIETQCEEVMYRTRYLKKSLTKNPSGSEELGDSLALSDQYTCRQDCGDSGLDEPPRVILTSISRVASTEVQKSLRMLPVKVIAIDEAQVADPDPDSGWGEFLPYK